MSSTNNRLSEKTIKVFKALRKTNKRAAYEYINFAHVRENIEKSSYRSEAKSGEGKTSVGDTVQQAEGSDFELTDGAMSVRPQGLEYHQP